MQERFNTNVISNVIRNVIRFNTSVIGNVLLM